MHKSPPRCFNIPCVHPSVFIRYSDITARIWTRQNLRYCFNILTFHEWFLLCFNWKKNYYVCKCVTVLCTVDHFESTTLTVWKLPEDGTHGVPKHEGWDFVHLLCIYTAHVGLIVCADVTHTHTHIHIYIYIYIHTHKQNYTWRNPWR
jgi:hypothetical protein